MLLAATCVAESNDRPSRRVLFIGLDGCRSDMIAAAATPNLRALIADGAVSYKTTIRGPRPNASDSISGPGWSNLLTGVWPDKHGVLDNEFKVTHYDKYPHFFARVKQSFAGARTYSYCVWEPIASRIVAGADESICFDGDSPDFAGDGVKGYLTSDEKCTAKAVQTLTERDPDVMFVYLGSIDVAGHKHGFHPSVAQYKSAVEVADRQIGQIIAALRKRPRYADERWLVLMSTDHGGRGETHAGQPDVPETNTVFLIVSGADAARGTIDEPTAQVDVAMTALAHLGAEVDPKWQLDGRAVGLKQRADK